jgi:hypothetical protein
VVLYSTLAGGEKFCVLGPTIQAREYRDSQHQFPINARQIRAAMTSR